jgi:transposase
LKQGTAIDWDKDFSYFINFLVILDNATFHKSEKIKELAQCELQYLSRYSPDFNEIEHYWFSIKNRVRKYKETIEDFREGVDRTVCLAS